jgi:hypothetical protein
VIGEEDIDEGLSLSSFRGIKWVDYWEGIHGGTLEKEVYQFESMEPHSVVSVLQLQLCAASNIMNVALTSFVT